MANLYRASKVLKFDDQELIVRELEVETLIKAQRGEITLTDDVLIMECCGTKKADLTLKAYEDIMTAINELHKDVFDQGEDEEDDSKKN